MAKIQAGSESFSIAVRQEHPMPANPPSSPHRAVFTVFLLLAAPLAAEPPATSRVAEVKALDVYDQEGTVDLLLAVDDGARLELRHRRSRDGAASWGVESRVELGGAEVFKVHPGSEPQIAAHGDRLVVVWTAPGTSKWGTGPLASATSSDGGRSWKSGPNPVDTGSTEGHGFVDLAADGAGVFHAVWLDGRSGTQGLYASRSRDGGRSWETNRTIDSATCTCCWNRMIAPAAGEVLVIYRDDVPRDLTLAEARDGGQTWKRLAAAGSFGWQFNGCPDVGGALALGRAGTQPDLYALTWTGQQDKLGLYTVRSQDLGRTWSQPLPVADGTGHRGDLAIHGSVLGAVWDAPNGDGRQVQAAISRDGGRTWNEPKRLSAEGAIARQPRVVVAGERFMAFWTEKSGDKPAVWSSAVF